MKNILLNGCNGKMGQVITSCVEQRSDCRIAAGFDINTTMLSDFPVFSDPEGYTGDADVIIDFSHPSALSGLLAFAKQRKLPIVVATTGLSPEQVEEVKDASKSIPVFYSGNMSLGINLLMELAKKATAVLGGSFDIEIVEQHHSQKIDAPSGTALMLADCISSALPEQPRYVYDRHSQRKKRDKGEIGIHSIRGGTIVGEHEVIFAGRDEVITLSHSAHSKEVFATGSVNAALFLIGKEPGLYDMGDLVASKN